jgi:uncharacterized protein YndB with AHSA1/START domain
MSDRPSFVYVTYIASTPEKVWTALTDGKFTREYWGGRIVECDWKPGSTMSMRKADGSDDGAKGQVLEVDPPKRLVMSWTFAMPGQPRSPATKVTYQITPAGPENVRLTLTHEEYEPGSFVPDMVREGWSAILSSLKSFLETGRALDVTKRWAAEGK